MRLITTCTAVTSCVNVNPSVHCITNMVLALRLFLLQPHNGDNKQNYRSTLHAINTILIPNNFLELLANKSNPSEEFELTANSLGAHIETHGGLILGTLSWLTVNSQDELTLWACCELSMSFQLTQWSQCYHCTVSSLGWSHKKLTASSHSEFIQCLKTFLDTCTFSNWIS